MDVSDETLARAAADGDREAFALLAERVYDRVYGYAIRLTGNRAEAEDLAQDLLVSLPRRLGSFRGESRLSTWLYRVAVNAARDRFRRQAAQARAAEGWGDWEQARKAGEAEQKARSDWLAEAMNGLSMDLRETLALVLDGLSHRETGEVLGISEGTVSWRLSEARKRLRALKEEEAAE